MAEHRFVVAGDVDLATGAELQAKLMVLATVTTDDLVLDCADLEFIDSIGIGVFVHIRQLLEAQDRRLRIENMNDRVRRPFDVLGLTELFGIGTPEPAN